MEVNLPIWKYYEPGFVDPLFAPYQFKLRPGQMQGTGRRVGVPVNPYKRRADPMYSSPALERKGWGLSFQRQYDYDPCPAGWARADNGWCYPTHPEQGEGIFYSADAFLARPQHWTGYTKARRVDDRRPPLNNFDNRSVSLHTGRHVTTHPSFPDQGMLQYNLAPARDSYVGE